MEKLIDVISKGIGTIYKPRAIRKEAEAKAYKIERIERAKSKAIIERREMDADFNDRMQDRLFYRETQRQLNIDNVTAIAAEQLEQEASVSDEPVDTDWATRFFNIVEDISDGEIQTLWGRILAGEVKSPNSYSLRTLELLKNFSKTDAQIFMKVAKFAISSDTYYFLPYFDPSFNHLSKHHKINYSDILILEEIGLVNNQRLRMQLAETKDIERIDFFMAGKIGLVLLKEKECPRQDIDVFYLSKAGIELLPLIEPINDGEYIKSFAKSIRHEKTKMKYGDKEISKDGILKLINLQDISID